MLTCARRLSAVGSAVKVRVVSRPSPWGLGHLNLRGGAGTSVSVGAGVSASVVCAAALVEVPRR